MESPAVRAILYEKRTFVHGGAVSGIIYCRYVRHIPVSIEFT
mgnify:CR=1 FL=1